MNNLLSIIVPVYNGESTLGICIDSILSQAYCDWELILIDDGSTDATRSICDKYAQKDSRIRVAHKQNGGVSSARNYGLDMARGEWISFVDSDDHIESCFYPLRFDSSINLYVQNWRNRDTGNLEQFIDAQTVEGHGVKIFLSEHIHKFQFRCPWGKIYRRDIIERNNIRFKESINIGEDTLFVLEYLLYCSKINVLSNSVYNYKYAETGKYILTIEQSISYIDLFWKRYKALSCNSKPLLKLIYHFYYGITKDIELPDIYRKWINSYSVIRILHALYYDSGVFSYMLITKMCLSAFVYKIRNTFLNN